MASNDSSQDFVLHNKLQQGVKILAGSEKWLSWLTLPNQWQVWPHAIATPALEVSLDMSAMWDCWGPEGLRHCQSRMSSGCPPEHSRTEWEKRNLGCGWMDQDSLGLCPISLWDRVLWYLPVGSWDSWHMKLRVIASWTSWGRWTSCMRVVLHGQLSQALEK